MTLRKLLPRAGVISTVALGAFVLLEAAFAEGDPPAQRASAGVAGNFKNPKVQPGRVNWHRDFDAACQAAQKCGKPVLLFQMIGRLDDRFC